MIYISTSGIKKKSVVEVIKILVENGVSNIELSGGNEFEDNLFEIILSMKEKYSLNLLVHNYFPPPANSFVLNLASLNDSIFEKTLNFYQHSIEFARALGLSSYSLHAGFFVDPKEEALGKTFLPLPLSDKDLSIDRFCAGFNILAAKNPDFDLYVENNVLSFANFNVYREKVFMLLDSIDYKYLKSRLKFKLLLDIGHLKVTSHTLGLDFFSEFDSLFDESTYLHISENDGLADSNQILTGDSLMWKLLQGRNLAGKIVSLEIADGLIDIISCARLFENTFLKTAGENNDCEKNFK